MAGDTAGEIIVVNKGGRPVLFDAQTKAAFLEHLASGLSNAKACERTGISRPFLHLHLSRDIEFRDAYREAKALAVDALIDQADELAELAPHAESGVQIAGIKVAIDHLWRKDSRIAPQRWVERPASVAMVVSDVASAADLAKRMAFLEVLQKECQKR